MVAARERAGAAGARRAKGWKEECLPGGKDTQITEKATRTVLARGRDLP